MFQLNSKNCSQFSFFFSFGLDKLYMVRCVSVCNSDGPISPLSELIWPFVHTHTLIYVPVREMHVLGIHDGPYITKSTLDSIYLDFHKRPKKNDGQQHNSTSLLCASTGENNCITLKNMNLVNTIRTIQRENIWKTRAGWITRKGKKRQNIAIWERNIK